MGHGIAHASIAAGYDTALFDVSQSALDAATAAIAAIVGGGRPGTPKFVNTCYSLVAPDYGISVAMVYGYKDGKIVKVDGSGGLSPMDVPDFDRKQEALYADGWYRSISNDIWG